MDVELVEDVVDGGLLACKRATTPTEELRLDREREVLHAIAALDLALPPVALVVDDDRVPPLQEDALVTVGVVGPSLAAAPPLPPEEVAGVMAAVARSLADLHLGGFVHGAVEPGHVVLDEGGRPVLCSLGRGGPIGADPVADDRSAAPLLPSEDVRGWGDLVTHLLDWSQAGADLDADALWARGAAVARHDEPDRAHLGHLRADLASVRGKGRRRPDRDDPQAGACAVLRALAAQATSVDPAVRPPAATLAAAVLQRVPTSRLPLLGEPAVVPRSSAATTVDPAAPARRWGRPGLRAVALGVAAVATVLAVPAAAALVRPPARPRSTGRCPVLTGPGADVDGDGCDDPVSFAGGVVSVGRARFAVGGPDASIAVGDWDCDGLRTLAVLQPPRVVVFDGWAATDADLVGRVVGSVDHARSLRAEPGGGCDHLIVGRSAGGDVTVDPRPKP